MMRHSTLQFWFFCLLAISLPTLSCLATVIPSSMFGDNMVLQRDMPVPVWGAASPGERVTVTFAGHTVTARADQQGKWRVFLPALTASDEGRKMQIKGENTITFEDVLIGEVWVCSGQSNMQYGWGKQSLPMFNWGGDAELTALVEDARKKPIRSYTVRTDVSFIPKENCREQWSTDVSGSAVAFGLSYYLHEAIDVPIAVIVACRYAYCGKPVVNLVNGTMR